MSTPAAATSATRGGLFVLISQGGQQLLSVLATVALARLLVPHDFGVIAAATSIVGFAYIALSVGFGRSILRRHDADALFIDSMFWSAVLASSVVAIALATVALLVRPLFGWSVALYAVAAAPTVVLSLAASIPNSLLLKRQQFRDYAIVQVLAMAAYVTVQVLLAVAGFGPWSVLVGQYALNGIVLVGAMLRANYLPKRRLDRALVKPQLRSGAWFLSSQAGGYVTKNVDYWIVIAFLDARTLGLYYIGYVLPTIVRQRLTSSAASALAPLFGRSHHDPKERSILVIKTARMLLFLGAPSLILLSAAASEIVQLFFGSRWVSAAGPMRIIAVAALVDLSMAGLWQLAEMSDRLPRYSGIQWARAGLTALSITVACTLDASMQSVAFGLLAATVLTAGLGAALLAPQLDVQIVKAGKLFAGATAVAVCAVIPAVAVAAHVQPVWLRVMTESTSAAVLYAILCLTVARRLFAEPILSCAAAVRLPNKVQYGLSRLVLR